MGLHLKVWLDFVTCAVMNMHCDPCIQERMFQANKPIWFQQDEMIKAQLHLYLIFPKVVLVLVVQQGNSNRHTW